MRGLFLPLIGDSCSKTRNNLVKAMELLRVRKKVPFPEMKVLLDVLLNRKLDCPSEPRIINKFPVDLLGCNWA